MKNLYLVGFFLLVILLNHVFVFTHPLYILALAVLFIISGSLFMFYGAKEDTQAESFFFDNMNLMSLVAITGFIILLIEFFVPYYATYTGYMLSTGTSTFFSTLSMNLFNGAIILIGISIIGGFVYYFFFKKIAYD